MASEQEIRFQAALASPGHSIREFFTESPADLVPNLRGPCPQFFNHNLVSPFRVIKQFKNSEHANIRLFYFVLLRGTYEVETEEGFNTEFMNNFMQLVFHPEFEIFFTVESQEERDLYNDAQFKKLFAEFVTSLQGEVPTNVERVINSYPIIDTVFIHIIRSILASQGVSVPFESKIPTPHLFQALTGLIGMNLTQHSGNCWKFEDSDMFCYELSEDELYLAYTVDTGNVTSEEASDNPLALAGNFDTGTTQTISVSEMPIGSLNPVEQIAYKYEEPARDYLGLANAAPLAESNYVSSYANSQVNASSSYAAAPFTSYESTFTNTYASKPLTSGTDYTPYVSPLDQYTKPNTTSGYPFSAQISYEPARYETPSYLKTDLIASIAPIAPIASIAPLPTLPQTFGTTAVATAGWSSSSISIGGGDYINDFTNDQLVEKMEEPYKSKVLQIKQRVKDWKRPQGVAGGVGGAAGLYGGGASYGVGASYGSSFGGGLATGGYTSSLETVSYSRTLQI